MVFLISFDMVYVISTGVFHVISPIIRLNGPLYFDSTIFFNMFHLHGP